MSWGKAIKCAACQAFYRCFHNEFNRYNNTGARKLGSVYHMTLELIKNRFFAMSSLRNVVKSVNH